jgi:glycerol-1-phosphate dehydrogenase [NAD(P)+]
MYEAIGKLNPGSLDVDRAVVAWPDPAANEAEIASLFTKEELAEKAREESGVKHLGRAELRTQLERLKAGWPELARRLREQLYWRSELADMLREAGSPTESHLIGIAPERLRRSYRQAYHIRRRFTVLDVARRSGLFEPALDLIFNAQ